MNFVNRAMNYETLIKVSNKGDAFCIPLFKKIKDSGVDIDTPLVYDPITWANYISTTEYEIQKAFLFIRESFSKLPKNTVILCEESTSWPIGLKKVPFLYLQGRIEILNRSGVSIVGTRVPSKVGIELASQTVEAVGKKGFAIFSGLALGIDGVAHLSSLKQGFDTIAVIGTSLDKCYPPEHEKLQNLIAEQGLLVSQISPSRTQQKWFFLVRNQLMAFLSKATVVVEDRDGGGAVQQAGYALKQKRRAFTFQENYDNRSLLWPRKINGLEIAKNPKNLVTIINFSNKILKKSEKPLQPELF